MPSSIEPPPADDEIECGRCGAHVYYELTRCPNCGVNLYEPDDTDRLGRLSTSSPGTPPDGFRNWLDRLIHRITRKPYAVDELFGAALNQAGLFDDLLNKVGGDRAKAERLIDFERQQYPGGNRLTWLGNAIDRWERDNRTSGRK